MEIGALQPLVQLGELSRSTGAQRQPENSSFQNALKEAISQVNEAQHASAQATQAMAAKEPIDLHEVMITANKASIALQATLEVRNKAVEAYQEMMRMQV